nr:immunoglobulin light chain junction region [Macaca mulatta]MOV66250.1 immunoglobulin light chain junction region [Macaca mulatta]MOV66636.1 immunoglobulin light chain junction region [Macaca mulatta]MOV68064.1 immunoglobulin light chain junction region [Macaca mulatta]MOV68229.1 immunoglobulin light chain junction region [Macaca mulatta]
DYYCCSYRSGPTWVF